MPYFRKVEETLKHNRSRHSLAIPWKENCPTLPNNREMTMKRLGRTENNLQTKYSFVEKEYGETIKSYVEKGYLRKLFLNEVVPIIVLVFTTFSYSKVGQNNHCSAHSIRLFRQVRRTVSERCYSR